MTITFAAPLVRLGARPASSSFGKFFANLFKNKGVQVGTGLAATGGGIAFLGAGARSATGEFSPIFSPIIVIVVIVVILLMVMKR